MADYVNVPLSLDDIHLILNTLEGCRHKALLHYLQDKKFGQVNRIAYDLQEHCENLIDDLQLYLDQEGEEDDD